MKRIYWLIVSATDAPRIWVRKPQAVDLTAAEIALPITVNIPDGWGKVYPAGVEVQMPEPPTVEASGDGVRVIPS